jgi:hypothetical protein
MAKRFWKWYQDNYAINLTVSTLLFSLQLIHLFWLLTHVIFIKLGIGDFFSYFSFLNWPLVLIDYTEIPAIITTSLVYINEIRRKKTLKPWLYLVLLNIQWLHILWITDEFLLENIYFTGILWWMAVLIDYLELPVILDTVKRVLVLIKKGEVKKAFEAIE